MNFEIFLAIGAVIIGVLGGSFSKVVRAIFLESIKHPLRKAQIDISGSQIRIHQLP